MEEAKIEFLKYAKNYINLGNMITLKINHTFRVMDLCSEIATKLDLNEQDVKIAELCGLLHDIARFEQWRKYQTFADLKSIDHGDLGVEILKENNFIRKFNQDESLDDLIFKTIKNHNKYKIEEGLSEREKLFCCIVRDADKLDILYLYTTGEINLDLNDEDFSDITYNNLINEKTISREDKTTKADNLSISLGFVYDFNFKESYQILKDKDYLNKEINIYQNKTKNKQLIKKLGNVREVINHYIDRRCEDVR